jgi:hypothetical protein
MPITILLNGQPIEPSDCLDVEIIEEAFTWHFIRKPLIPKPKNFRALRRSAVRHIPVEQYLAERKEQ